MALLITIVAAILIACVMKGAAKLAFKMIPIMFIAVIVVSFLGMSQKSTTTTAPAAAPAQAVTKAVEMPVATPAPTPDATHVGIGEIGELRYSTLDMPVEAALTREALDELIKSWSAHDFDGIRELGKAGLLITVKQGTKVRKIDIHGWLGSVDEVRIVEGKHRGQKVFVAHEWVKPVAQSDDVALTTVKAVQETPAKEDVAEDAPKEARYLKEIAELLVNNEPLAKRGADVRTHQAALIITHARKLAEPQGIDAHTAFTQFLDAAKVWCARGLPPAATQELMNIYDDVITGMDLSPQHPEDSDLLSSDAWETNPPGVDQELPIIIRDAISGSQIAAKRLHVSGLQDLSAKERCERIIQVLGKRYHARAEREREKSLDQDQD